MNVPFNFTMVIILILCVLISSAVNPHEIQPSTSNQFPYLVSIVRITQYKFFTEICQSALISEVHVLTTQQCVTTITNRLVVPGLADDKNVTQLGKESIPIIDLLSPDSFDGNLSKAALLIVVLKERIPSTIVKPAILKRSPAYGELTILAKYIKRYVIGIEFYKVIGIDQKICKEKIKECCEADYLLFDFEFCTDRPHHLNRYSRYSPGSPVEADKGVIVGIVVSKNEDMHGCPGIHLSIASITKFIEHYVPHAKWID